MNNMFDLKGVRNFFFTRFSLKIVRENNLKKTDINLEADNFPS